MRLREKCRRIPYIRAAINIALLLAAVANCGPTDAQIRNMTTVMEMDGNRLSVTAREMQALSDVGNLVQSGSRIAQDQALARARQVAKGRDAVYALAVYQLEIGRRRQDDRMLANALDVLIDNGLSPANRLPGFLALRGQIAFRTGDIDKADRLWGRLAAMSPADADAQANLAQVKLARSEPIAALALLTRAVALRGAIDPHATEV